MGMIINPHRFVTVAGWTPPDLGANLVAWWKGDSLLGADGSNITQWDDSSGNGEHITASSLHPTVHGAFLNGINTVRFNGTNFFQPAGMPSIYNGKSEAMGFAVVIADADPGANYALWQIGSASWGDTWTWSDGNIYGGFCASSQKSTGNPSLSTTSWRIASFHSKANDWGVFIDGGSHFSTATNTFEGAGSQYIGSGLAGDIAEIVFTDLVLSQSEREKVEGYLAHKWALTGNLDAGHPYKSVPP